MEKQEIMNSLMMNPKFDADWITIAADMMIKEPDFFSSIKLAKFSYQQLTHIRNAYDELKKKTPEGEPFDFEPIEIIMNSALNATQIQILATGLVKDVGVNYVKLLANPNIPYVTMDYVMGAIVDGYPEIMDYLAFEPLQIGEIAAGMRDNLDYKSYAHKNFSAEKMALMRHALFVGIPIEFPKNIIPCTDDIDD